MVNWIKEISFQKGCDHLRQRWISYSPRNYSCYHYHKLLRTKMGIHGTNGENDLYFQRDNGDFCIGVPNKSTCGSNVPDT